MPHPTPRPLFAESLKRRLPRLDAEDRAALRRVAAYVAVAYCAALVLIGLLAATALAIGLAVRVYLWVS